MTDAIKMSEIQRASVEFERQRHLANWFIKSSVHMAKPSTNNSSSLQKSTSPHKNSSSGGGGGGGGGTMTENPLFFMASHQKLSMDPSLFVSQNNLPLEIVTQDGKKSKLRRFNSHDTSANMFSAVDFENARLARRNDVERQKSKMNSLSSGGDCSTGDSYGSKFSNESNPEPLPARIFLERYSLPRVIRLRRYSDLNACNTLLSSGSSNESSLSNHNKKEEGKCGDGPSTNGELFLLYRQIKNRKIYHGFNTKSGVNRKKEYKIPQEYSGYFSLVNERGIPTATVHTTIIQLVRERVYKFITLENISGYTEQTTEGFPKKSHYVKTTARAGQVYRLLAVFQDSGLESNIISGLGGVVGGGGVTGAANSLSSQKDLTSGRETGRGRYAQLLGENRQVVYVALSAKGKFYEIEQSAAQRNANKSNSLGSKTVVSKKMNSDCVHLINSISLDEEVEYPINLKLIWGPSGTTVPENLTVTRIATEDIVIVCPIEESDNRLMLSLRKIEISPDMLFTKCNLGFENEQRMFTNPLVQNLLKYCQNNIESFQKAVEVEHIQQCGVVNTSSVQKSDSSLKILRPLGLSKLLHRDKASSAHEKEDSIIFLTKNDLDNLEIQQQQKQLRQEEISNSGDHQTITDRMKVFQPNSKKKWFKNKKNSVNKTGSMMSLDFDVDVKKRSIDRYQDMSKLLQERFGEPVEIAANLEHFSNRPSSDLGISPEGRRSQMKKSMSLQDIVDCKPDRPMEVTSNLMLIESAIDRIEKMSEEYAVDADNITSIGTMPLPQEKKSSFISEKMFSEFHVKTKHHGKSTTNVSQLVHFPVPESMAVSEMKLPEQCDEVEDVRENGLSLEDDLPYSNVRDSLVVATVEKPPVEDIPIPAEEPEEIVENIYAEICTDPPAHTSNIQITGETHHMSVIDVTGSDSIPTATSVIVVEPPPSMASQIFASPKKSPFGSIRISITSDNNQFQHVSNISLIDTCNYINHDNIYNTLK